MFIYIFVDCRNDFAIKITVPVASAKRAKDRLNRHNNLYNSVSKKTFSANCISQSYVDLHFFDHCMMCIINNIFMSLLYQEFTSQRYKPEPAVILINTCHAEYVMYYTPSQLLFYKPAAFQL